MIYIDELKDLHVYKRQFLLPRNGQDKKKNCAAFLLTPNYESSMKLINNPLILNKYYNAYYMERDINLLLSESMELVRMNQKNYVHETETGKNVSYFNESGVYENYTQSIVYNGYSEDVSRIRELINISSLERCNEHFKAPIKYPISVTVYADDCDSIPYTTDREINIMNYSEDYIDLPKYIEYCRSEIYNLILHTLNPDVDSRLVNYCVSVLSGSIDTFEQDFPGTPMPDGYKKVLEILAKPNGYHELTYIIKNNLVDRVITNSVQEAELPFLTKLKRKISMQTRKGGMHKLNHALDDIEIGAKLGATTHKGKSKGENQVDIPTLDSIKSEIEQASRMPSTTGGDSGKKEEDIEECVMGYDYLNYGESYVSESFIKSGNIITFFDEAVDKSNGLLKRMLYKERIKNNKELTLIYNVVMADCPKINKTYLSLERYKQFNIFIDTYYYNRLFFENNMYKLDRGVELYKDFLNRILHNKNIETLGYSKNILLIPVMDWVDDIKTKSYIYKNDINPISMIYRLMVKDLPGLKKLLDMPVIFIGNGTYFKVDFNNFESKDINLFAQKLKQLYSVNSVDDEELPSDSKSAIADTIIDDIEDSQNVKIHGLTGKATEAPKTADEVKDKEKEDTKKAIKDKVEKAAEESKDKEEALEKLDDDEEFKKMILQLQDDHDGGVQMNASRTARMTELNAAILDKEVKGKKVKDILEQRRSLNEKPLEKVALPIDSADEEWKELVYPSMNKQYDPNDDIVAMLYDLTKKSYPISIRDITVDDTSTSEDYLYTYTIDMENHTGKRFKLRFDIPKLVNSQYMMLRGNKKTINTQSFLMPVLKTDQDTAQIISNYNKIFIRRFNTSTGRSNAVTDRLIKTIRKNKFKNITVEMGNNSMISNRYDLPIDYIDLSGVFSKIETHEVVLLFNYQEALELNGVDLTKGLPLGYYKKDKTVIYYNGTVETFLSGLVLSWLYSDEEFKTAFDSTKAASKATYSKASILNVEIPLIVVAGFSVGLTKVLDRAKIKYEFKEKITNTEKKYIHGDYIKFSDGYLTYENTYEASLLLNGLKECDTESYSVMDVNNKSMFLDFLDNFGGKLKADGIDNFYDCMIDPITADVLEHYKLPGDYIDLLIYANNLLIDNKYIKFSSTEGRRLRRNELIAAYFYKALSSAYGSYSASLKHGRDTILSMKQSAVIDLILLDPTSSDLSIINPLSEKEAYDTVSAKGLSGMNSDRSFSLDKRAFDDSMINTLALSTGFAGTVGINRQATINANVDTVRGYIGDTDSKEMGTTSTLCMSEALTPMGTTHDDPFRSAMTFVQTTKHGMRVEKSDPLLITNGADKALPYLISDIFAHKAKGKGEVMELEEDFMIIKYDDGTSEYIDLSSRVEKNSSAGFYVELKLSPNKGIKKGSKVKPNQIVAYDHSCFSLTTGIDDDIAYDIGTLVLCALMDTDEGFEDSAIISEALSEAMRSDVIVQKELNLSKDTNIYNIVTPGTPVQEGDTLMVMQSPFDEEDANALLKTLADDIGEISDLGRIPIKSKVTGIVQDVQIYRTVELEELSDSLKALCKKYEAKDNTKRQAMKKYGIEEDYKLRPNYKLNATGKLKGASDGVMIVFSLKYSDKMSVGDKMIYYSANKGVIKDIFPEGKEPYFLHDKDKEKLDTLVSIASTNGRMVTVIQNTGTLNYLLVEASKRAKEIAGIKYKKRLLTD